MKTTPKNLSPLPRWGRVGERGRGKNHEGWMLLGTLLVFFFAVQKSGIADSPLRLNFRECVDLALKNNDQIRAARAEADVAIGKELEAHPRGIPVVKYEHRVAPIPQDVDNAAESFFGGDITVFNNFKIELGSPLTTFGRIRTAQELASLGFDASLFKRGKSIDEIILKVYQTYQGLILARELLGLAGQAVDAIEGKIASMEKERVKDQLAILKLKVALYEVQRKQAEANKKKQLALMALKFQVGVDLEDDFDVRPEALSAVGYKILPVQAYVDQSKSYLPEYHLLETGILAREKQLKLEKMATVPGLGIGAFFDIGRAPNVTGEEDESTFTNPFNFTKAGIGLQLKGEFDYAKRRAKVKQAEAELVKMIYDKRAGVRGLELDIRKAYLELQEAANLMGKADKEKRTAQQIVFLTKSNLDIGLGEKKDYFDALQSFLLFQGRQLEAIFNYNIAVATLRTKIGDFYEEQKKEIR